MLGHDHEIMFTFLSGCFDYVTGRSLSVVCCLLTYISTGSPVTPGLAKNRMNDGLRRVEESTSKIRPY
jgi:hypothetical protein